MKTDIEKGIDVEIDEITHCLRDVKTGEEVNTEYSIADRKELIGLQRKGWLFNWNSKELKDYDVYKLTIAGSSEIQGLVAIKENKQNSAYYVRLTESAPQNRVKPHRYSGVGGHLFAIAAKKSYDSGYGGFLYFEAKNQELVRHYEKALHAYFFGMPHEYSMHITEEAAKWLMEEYSL